MRNDERLRTIYEVMAPYIVRNEHNWRDYLAFASQFHKHSFDNILLVYAQDEDVSILATRKQWAAIGRNLIPRAKGVAVCVYRNAKLTLDYLFDVSQTTGKEIHPTVTTCNVKGERVTIKKDKAKNKSSLRTYPLIPFLKERLLEAKKQQEENRKLCGRSYNKEYLGYVCVDVIGNLIKPNYVSSTFGKLLAKNNLRHIRFHDLRHTCASLLLANGVPMEQVKEWLGHSEISTTVDIYGHLQYATKKQSAAAIEQDIVAPMLQNLSAVSP